MNLRERRSLALVWLLLAGCLPEVVAAADRVGIDAKETARLIISRTNAFREQEKLPPVAANAILTKTAEYFAQYMATKGVYGHTADGKQPVDRATAFGYDHCIISENIAHATNGQPADELAAVYVDLWEKSPGHLVNLVDPDVTEIGAAVAQSPTTGQVYAVQMFGRPKSALRSFSVVNETLDKIKYRVGEQPYEADSGERVIHYYCRPPVVAFAPAEKPSGPSDSVKASAAVSYKPRDGVTVALRQNRDGSWQLLEREK